MATYKVLQDIEAEDKLIGPLTLKQFVFAIMTFGLGYLQFAMINSGAPSFLNAGRRVSVLLYASLNHLIGADEQ